MPARALPGNLWQGRFGSVVMDDAHLAHAVRCMSLNPACAKLLAQAADGSWASVAAHLSRSDDGLVRVAPILERYGDFAALRKLRQSESTGRSIGTDTWLDALETATVRSLKPQNVVRRGSRSTDNKLI